LDNGELWHCGEDVNGQGAHGNINNEPGYFMKVLGLQDTKIIKVVIAKGNEDNVFHTLALDNKGFVYSWGYNGYGQLGLGHSNYQVVPRRIPREYFAGEEIVDIYASGTTNGTSYARTAAGYLYAWGRNDVGQLGVGDTADRWRPEKIVSWDPIANNGIVKFCPAGWGGNAHIHLLDGNGYMWHSGYNGYGVAINAGTTNNSTLARSTVSPTAGNVVDFWNSSPNGYSMLWMRTANGNTYFCGYSGGYYGGINATTSSVSSPTQVQRVQNCVRAFCVGNYSTYLRSYWLTESGELWAVARSNNGGTGNPYASSGGWNGEDGSTYYPYRVFLPTSTKIVDMMSSCCDESSSVYGPHNHCIADNGQMFSFGTNVGGYISGQANGNGYPNMVASRKSFN
jgi:alpha-tubulin suppressor-like RCC1 family protein